VSKHEEVSKGSLITNAKLCTLGDKYDISALKGLVARQYQEVVKDM
jgi:hypothetical protein